MIGYVPADGNHCLFAAGAETVVLDCDKQQIQRFHLQTQKLEATQRLSLDGAAVAAAMGNASRGPVLIAGEAGKRPFHVELLDLETLQPPDYQITRQDNFQTTAVTYLRASGDGRVFGVWRGNTAPTGLQTLIVHGNELRPFSSRTPPRAGSCRTEPASGSTRRPAFSPMSLQRSVAARRRTAASGADPRVERPLLRARRACADRVHDNQDARHDRGPRGRRAAAVDHAPRHAHPLRRPAGRICHRLRARSDDPRQAGLVGAERERAGRPAGGAGLGRAAATGPAGRAAQVGQGLPCAHDASTAVRRRGTDPGTSVRRAIQTGKRVLQARLGPGRHGPFGKRVVALAGQDPAFGRHGHRGLHGKRRRRSFDLARVSRSTS